MVDTVPDLAFCLDRALIALGAAPVGEQKVRGWVGDGLSSLINQALEWSCDETLDDALVQTARTLFLELYATHTSERSQIYEGVATGLDYLREGGAQLACVTNKGALYTEKLLAELGLKNRFAMIVSGDTLDTRKPDPGPLLHVARELGAEPRECLLVGDSRTDVEAARAARFAIICVSYGYNRGLDIRFSRPDAVIDSLAELETLFDKVG